jgi:predicted transcriptional regulator
MMSDEELIDSVRSGDDPFVSAREVAEANGMARQTAYKHLQRLYESGRIEKKKVGGSAVIWWCSDRCR